MNESEHYRRKIIMSCFDKLPRDLRDWINNLHFRITDDYILEGEDKVRWFKKYVESGGRIVYTNDGDEKN